MEEENLENIDFVLTYKSDDTKKDRTIKREEFQSYLKDEGLVLSRIELEGKVFECISLPWETSCKWAERLEIRKTIKVDLPEVPISGPSILSVQYCTRSLDLPASVLPETNFHFTAPFSHTRLPKFRYFDEDTKEKFFTKSEKILMVWTILTRSPFFAEEEKDEKVGIEELLYKGVYEKAFPLHDSEYTIDDPDEPKSDRQLLNTEWVLFKNILKEQPLWLIRKYFGDQIGIYFVFIGYYNQIIIPLMLIGLLTLIIGIVSPYIEGFSNDTSNACLVDNSSMGALQLCPLCSSDCQMRHLSDLCVSITLNQWFQNSATIVFSFILCIWAAVFSKMWTQRRKTVAWQWDMVLDKRSKQIRPHYQAEVTNLVPNWLTGREEPLLPAYNKGLRLLFSGSVVFIFVIVAMFVQTIGNIWLRDALKIFFNRKEGAGIFVAVISGLVSLVAVKILDQVYFVVVPKLTRIELPRTLDEEEISYTLKMFIFMFFNYFSTIFYIGFFKGKFFRDPTDLKTGGANFIRNDRCDEIGCWWEMTVQLATFMFVQQLINNLTEILLPELMAKVNEWRGGQAYMQHRLLREYDLEDCDDTTLFYEYLEIAVQYAFVTLFGAVFPLAPFLAFSNNLFEIRVDAAKFTRGRKRTISQGENFIWLKIIQFISYASIFSNAFILSFTSDFVPRILYQSQHFGKLEGFLESQFSEFALKNWGPVFSDDWPGPTSVMYEPNVMNMTCFFKVSNARDWSILSGQLVFFLLFVGCVELVAYFLIACTPDVPFIIQEQMEVEKAFEQKIIEEEEEEGGT